MASPRNVARLAVLTGVTNFLMFLSKIVVVGLCAALSYIFFSGKLLVCSIFNVRIVKRKCYIPGRNSGSLGVR